MKRIFLSIGITFVLLFIYYAVVATYVATLYFHYHQYEVLRTRLAYPIMLPKLIYFYFFSAESERPYFSETKQLVLSITFFVTNVLLYSIPVYFLLKFILRFRKPKPLETDPPPPFETT